MSKKPTLTIRYPEASEKALKLTEAMVKRSPGKRVVETESEDPIFPDGGDLFSSFIRCKTSTGVDLTLTLNPASMDYALETLIRPNLNAEERKRILGESEDEEQAELGLDGGAQAAQAPGQDKSCTTDVRSASLADGEAATQSEEQGKQIEIGKLTDVDLRIILTELLDKYKNALVEDPERLIEDTIKEIDYEAGVIDLDETYHEERDYSYKTYALFGSILARIEMLKASKNPSPQNTLILFAKIAKDHLKQFQKDAEGDFLDAFDVAYPMRNVYATSAKGAESIINSLTEHLYNEDHRVKKSDPTWDDVEKAAQTIGQKSEPASEPAGEADSDIDPGLLNDLDEDKKEGEKE